MIVTEKPYLVPCHYPEDRQGAMGVIDDRQLPFKIRRVFWLNEIPENSIRGRHAHRSSKQVIICMSGSIEAFLEDINGKSWTFHLLPGRSGLYVPPLYWGSFTFGEKTTAVCLASDWFNEEDYIRDLREFQKLRHAH